MILTDAERPDLNWPLQCTFRNSKYAWGAKGAYLIAEISQQSQPWTGESAPASCQHEPRPLNWTFNSTTQNNVFKKFSYYLRSPAPIPLYSRTIEIELILKNISTRHLRRASYESVRNSALTNLELIVIGPLLLLLSVG